MINFKTKIKQLPKDLDRNNFYNVIYINLAIVATK